MWKPVHGRERCCLCDIQHDKVQKYKTDIMATFKTLKDYIQGDDDKSKKFVIPNYQRGYKWAVKEEGKLSHVEKLCEDLIKAYKEKKKEYFLQGITVSEEKDNKIILIDGQQRTITLYLLLWCFDKSHIKHINLIYDIREQSKNYINSLKTTDELPNNADDENYQDIHYFKEAVAQIKRRFSSIEDKYPFLTFILEKVRVLYINIEEGKAIKTFTMMNGSKATMSREELIKAEMLRKISLLEKEQKNISTSVDEKEIIAKEWETNALRSRYAREWDKWLYWWNRKDVQVFFNVADPTKPLEPLEPLRLLLEHHYKNTPKHKKEFSFDNFKNLLINTQETKKQFKQLRDLQKSFEDIFNTPKTHNYLKMSLICATSKDDRYNIINYFINKKNEKKLIADYAKWRLVNATHWETIDTDNTVRKTKAVNALNLLSDRFVYLDAYDLAAKQLLRLNVEEDNKLNEGKGRTFDFSIYGEMSLEHIHPRSKAYHKEKATNKGSAIETKYKDGNDYALGKTKPQGREWLDRDAMGKEYSEHCIGNLVLLDKSENSKFYNKLFSDKKDIYFNVNEIFKSRNLLHTIAVFAKSNWEIAEIKKNHKTFIERFKQDYNINNDEL
jgi:hypothetical protein